MIYLDNAATTFPKPETVYDTVDRFQRNYAVNAGRGMYKTARIASDMIGETRKLMADLTKCRDENRVIFSPSATIAMNQVLCGMNYSPDTVIYISPFEHNAVVRPLYRLSEKFGFRIEIIPFDRTTQALDFNAMKNQFVIKHPDIVILNHISNVTGLILPIETIFSEAKKYNSVNILDASQSLGVLPVDLSTDIIDFAVFAGHKNLYSNFGVGGFIYNTDIPLKTFITGGTGSDSLNPDMSDKLPIRFEPASHDIIALSSLNASLKWLNHTGLQNIYQHKKILSDYAAERLNDITSIKTYLPSEKIQHISVISFTHEEYRPEEIADILDNEYDIAVRCGYHCAPFVHKLIGTENTGGTVRVSVGYFNTKQDIDILANALSELD